MFVSTLANILPVHNYKKTSMPALKLDAQVSVIEAALAGYNRWRTLEKLQKVNTVFKAVMSDD